MDSRTENDDNDCSQNMTNIFPLNRQFSKRSATKKKVLLNIQYWLSYANNATTYYKLTKFWKLNFSYTNL